MRKVKPTTSALRSAQELRSDVFIGTACDLVDAGVITTAQLPGQPGMPKSSCSFVDGVPIPRYSRPNHDERWMQVTIYASKIRVLKGLTAAERERRRQENEAKRKAAGIPAIGLQAAARQVEESSAVFFVGDSVIAEGRAATVTGGYGLRTVQTSTGEYVTTEGTRVDYRHGYVCRDLEGNVFFWAAHEVRTAAGQCGHLRLVRNRTSIAEAAPEVVRSSAPVLWPFPVVGGTSKGQP